MGTPLMHILFIPISIDLYGVFNKDVVKRKMFERAEFHVCHSPMFLLKRKGLLLEKSELSQSTEMRILYIL
jgi:fatty acid-binding protein DegV